MIPAAAECAKLFALAVAVALAFLVVIPEGDLLLSLFSFGSHDKSLSDHQIPAELSPPEANLTPSLPVSLQERYGPWPKLIRRMSRTVR